MSTDSVKRGKFIVVEGCDGSGKTTAVQYLTTYMHSKNVDVSLTAEPTRSLIGGFIRGILTGDIEKPPNALLANFFVADRYYHTKKVLEPLLVKGISMVCDRYIWSTLAYQAHTVSDVDSILDLHKGWYLPPDYLIYLATSPEVSCKRMRNRQSLSVFDNLETVKKVQKRYEYDIMGRVGFGENTVSYYIDANKSLEYVQRELRTIADDIF